YPRVVGRSVGLHPLVSMFVILSGGALFGILGMLLAFPIAGSLKVVLDRLLRVTSQTTSAATLPAVPLRHRSGL
ncbi:MAG: AI-2E family transporter, partial [Fimbriimonadales bacterium]